MIHYIISEDASTAARRSSRSIRTATPATPRLCEGTPTRAPAVCSRISGDQGRSRSWSDHADSRRFLWGAADDRSLNRVGLAKGGREPLIQRPAATPWVSGSDCELS